MNKIFIGIDLAWGEKNLSGFSVLQEDKKKLKILEISLIKSIDEIILAIQKYKDYNVYIGVDAPLVIPNQTANREIEKNFNKDFSKYKISMLPVNRNLLTKYSQNIRSEDLFLSLSKLGFIRDYKSDKVIFEVYTHSTIAVCFNNFKILPYKRKKGRDTEFIKEQLCIYQNYLKKVLKTNDILKENISRLRGQKIKDFEDKLDSLTCAYSMYYCLYNEKKFYQIDAVNTFVTPISPWKLYILRCNDDSLYTGITTNLNRRLYEHNNSSLASKYTRVRRPVKLVYSENCENKSSASKREYEIKQLSRKEKLELINV